MSFAEFGAIDARYVYRDMQSDVVRQLRAEDSPGTHPLLPMRISRMDGVRADLVQMAQTVVEAGPSIDTIEKTRVMLLRIARAKGMMLRVLECSSDPQIKALVRECALAIASSLEFTARALGMTNHRATNVVQNHANVVRQFADEVDYEANVCRQTYQEMTVRRVNAPEKAVLHISDVAPSESPAR